jgi:hypothetical protein
VHPVGAPGSGANAGLRAATQSAKLLVGDFNGDGIDDLFRGAVFLSSGTELTKEDWANQDWGRIGDFNADGLTDMFVLDGLNGTTSKLLLSTGSGFDASPIGQTLTNRGNYHWPEFEDPNISYNLTINPYGAIGSDRFVSNSSNGSTGTYYIDGVHRGVQTNPWSWNGYVWGANLHYSGSNYYIYRQQTVTENHAGRLGFWGSFDANGDGATDFLQILETNGVRSLVAYTATGATLEKTTLIANLSGSAIGSELDFSLLDVNGDGKAELVRPDAAGTAHQVHALDAALSKVYSIAGLTAVTGVSSV